MKCSIGRLLCVAFLSTTAIAAAAPPADRTSAADAPDTKISVVPEPTESPRYLRDEHQVTQGSMTIAGKTLG